MSTVTEIKVKFSLTQNIIHYLGNHDNRFSKWVRTTYWKRDHKYLWGIINWCLDFESEVVELNNPTETQECQDI